MQMGQHGTRPEARQPLLPAERRRLLGAGQPQAQGQGQGKTPGTVEAPPAPPLRISLPRWMLRPFQMRWSRGPRLVWVERRKTPALDRTLAAMRADLRAELLAHDHSAQDMLELVRVDEQLAQAGWAGLSALPVRVLRRALLQAEMLVASTDSRSLVGLVVRLQQTLARNPATPADPTQTAALAHPEPDPGLAAPPEEALEVVELGEDDYTQAEAVWAHSRAAALVLPGAPEDRAAPP